MNNIIEGKECFIYGEISSKDIIIQPVNENEFEMLEKEIELIKNISGRMDFCFIAILIDDWNYELSPWGNEGVFKGKDFGNGARKTLNFITGKLLPFVFKNEINNKRLFLGGYSLSGLFSLWSCYQCDIFYAVAVVSPSVWFPGWTDYIKNRNIKCKKVYLSLGNKEDKVRNQIMSKVKANICIQYELIKNSNRDIDIKMELNPGNHFADYEKRTGKAFAWLIE
ncbi:Putative esterase [Acetitomaculum ruminis DSM 5522]|uniref:Putative esterase n=1 Tax=Acetitomaculum ruminis DSM 5522 TaxID=1120918 RepID=A0A1I0Z3H9_9FIRM|nr:alpha/beta hydrolase-fold protein [Acetitomaculum ruminis]SFB18823.1 Putative esterase [Acetitomaculum ruminis DSM 5522]